MYRIQRRITHHDITEEILSLCYCPRCQTSLGGATHHLFPHALVMLRCSSCNTLSLWDFALDLPYEVEWPFFLA